jgi:hypothetical protein
MPYMSCGVIDCPMCLHFGVTVDNAQIFSPVIGWKNYGKKIEWTKSRDIGVKRPDRRNK